MVDTVIRIFDSAATSFTSNGIGTLSDASRCEVVEERNGSFELELEYHISGKRYQDIALRRIIVAKPNPYALPQPFRIYSISKPINGLVTVKAEHISYDLSGYPVMPFTADGMNDALAKIKSNSIVDNNFEFFTDCPDSEPRSAFELIKPASMRAVLGGSEDSILEVYGGELDFNAYKVSLLENRGKDRGVTIRYGKNMTDLTQEENCADVYTAVYPYFYSEEYGLWELPEKLVQAPGTYDYVRVYPLDVSGEWNNEEYEWTDEYAAQEEIRAIARKYISDNGIGVPQVSLTVSFEQLSKSEEYAEFEFLEKVQLCDIVTVEFPKLNVSSRAKCIKTTYNVLTDKYVSIELGDAKSDLASSIVTQNVSVARKIEQKPTHASVVHAAKNAALLAGGGLGGHVVVRNSAGGDGYPDELLIMDTEDISTAQRIWRWNKKGLGYSRNGYAGPFSTAITQDGAILLSFVRGGVLRVGGPDNADGAVKVADADGVPLVKLDRQGITFQNGGSAPVVKIVEDTIKTTGVSAEHLGVDAANVESRTFSDELVDICGWDSRYEYFFRGLTPVLYTYKDNAQKMHVGYRAQTVTQALDNSSLSAGNAAVVAGGGGAYSLKSDELCALCVHMLQQAFQRIEALEAKLAEVSV